MRDSESPFTGHHKSKPGHKAGTSGRPPVLIRFLRKPFAQKRMLAEAFFWVGVFRFVIRFLPFGVLKRLIGDPDAPETESSGKTDTSGRNATDLNVPDTVEPGVSDPDETDWNASDAVGSGREVPDPAALIARSVAAVSRRVPWESKCLVQASAARIMLNKRGISNMMFLGVSKSGLRGLDPQTGAENPELAAQKTTSGNLRTEPTESLRRDMRPHAWLVVGGQVVLGGGNLDDYVTVSRFGN